MCLRMTKCEDVCLGVCLGVRTAELVGADPGAQLKGTWYPGPVVGRVNVCVCVCAAGALYVCLTGVLGVCVLSDWSAVCVGGVHVSHSGHSVLVVCADRWG